MPVLFLFLLTAFAATHHPRVAHAQTDGADKFTDRGRIMVNGAIGGRWSNMDSTYGPTQRPQWEVYAQPSVTYFLMDRVGIGLSVGGSFGQHTDSFGFSLNGTWTAQVRNYEGWVGPEATLELPLVDKLSLLALPGVYYLRHWRRLNQRSFAGNSGAIEGEEASRLDFLEHDAHFLRFALRLPIVYHVSPSIAIGLGPALWWDLYLSQDPRGNRIPVPSEFSPASPFPTPEYRTDPYPRTRLIVGLSSWLGGSF